MSKSGEAFILHLRSEASSIPVEVRLRRLLKLALRSFALRCTSIVEAPTEGDGPAKDVEPAHTAAGEGG